MNKTTAKSGLLIGQVAEASGLPKTTIQHWTDKGLLKPIGTNRAGYRLYAPDAPDTARRIKELADGGLSLEEIRARLDKDKASQ